MEKFELWNNDACKAYELLKKEFPDEDDDSLWDKAYGMIQYFKDKTIFEVLDVNMPSNLIAVNKIKSTHGFKCFYKDLETDGLALAITKVLQFNRGDNSYSLYIEDGNLLISQLGHDNPVNPIIYEIRMLENYSSLDDLIEDLSDDARDIYDNSNSIGDKVKGFFK